MEDKLVKVLLAQYKEKGIDMYALLDDRFFMDLTLQQKVDLIKNHAADISAGTNRALTKKDIRALVMDAGFAGLGTGMAAAVAAKSGFHHFHANKGILPTKYIVGAAALGAAVTAGNAYLGARKRINERDEILKKIDDTTKNPTDENALRVLTTRNHQFNKPSGSTLTSHSVRNVSNVVSDVPKVLLSQVPNYVAVKSMEHNFANNFNPYAADVTEDSLFAEVQKSRQAYVDNLKSTVENMTKNLFGH